MHLQVTRLRADSCIEATLPRWRYGIDETDLIGWAVAVISLAWAIEQRTFFGDGGQTIHLMVAKQWAGDARESISILICAFYLFPAKDTSRFQVEMDQTFARERGELTWSSRSSRIDRR